MSDYGLDWSCTLDLDPFGRTVYGVAIVREAAIRRMTTRTGAMLGDPLYGFDLQELLSSSGDARTIAAIVSVRVRQQVLRDERVQSCTVTQAVYDPGSRSLRIAIVATTGAGPFDLVFQLTTAGIAVVTGGAA